MNDFTCCMRLYSVMFHSSYIITKEQKSIADVRKLKMNVTLPPSG